MNRSNKNWLVTMIVCTVVVALLWRFIPETPIDPKLGMTLKMAPLFVLIVAFVITPGIWARNNYSTAYAENIEAYEQEERTTASNEKIRWNRPCRPRKKRK